jgi:drug/metabolite transporter (DMT)-like permease
MKALALIQQDVLPGGSSWFIASSTMTARFGIAALIMLAWTWRTLAGVTGLELYQGAGLGLFAGAGMILQMDGLAYTHASTSAFLTQTYCVFLPIVVALRERRWPSPLVLICSALAVVGVGVLANMNWDTFRLGRGELETILSSVVFGAQILWLERPRFSANRVNHFTFVMFATISMVSLPVSLLSMNGTRDWLTAYSSPMVLFLIAVLVLLCTMIAFVLMNYWQPHLPAPEAAVIYAAEPVFASLFALFLPAWLASFGGFRYANERITSNLLIGGGLITMANVLIQVRAWRKASASAPPHTAAPTQSAVPFLECGGK